MKCRFATIAKMLAVVALVAPSLLSAQAPSPRKPPMDTAKRTSSTATKSKADSGRMTLTDMKAWVDSAAGNTKALVTASDTADTAVAIINPPPPLPPIVSAPTPAPAQTTTFSNGAIAPNTASALPTILTIGLAAFAVGLMLFRSRRRQT
ncbi:MAG TPA: hypothetical protein VJO33_18865 [Gemmatimonadaceae bacterium]|nr:hypothetical protein [Gemmatimonadaceae bacterium]